MLLQSIRSLKTGSLLLAALAAATVPAMAGDTETYSKDAHKAVIERPKSEPRFYVDILAGGEFDTGVTDFTGDGFSPNLARPGLAGAPVAPAFIQARDFNETHDAAVIDGGLELGYKVLPYLSIFTSFTYNHAGGNDRANLGTVGLPAGGRVDLLAGIGQYQAYAGRLGVKLNTPRTILDFLHLPKAISPYATVSAGGKYVDSQYMRFYTDNGLVDTGRFKLYDDSWVFSVVGALGYDLKVARNFDIILESGYGYDSEPDSAKGIPVSGLSTKGSRVYSTVSLGAKLSF